MKRKPAVAAVNRILKRVNDPDMGINIVDLGLVYEVAVLKKEIHILMTFTSIGCPRGPEILYNIECELKRAFSEFRPRIDIVWDPAWSKERMSEEGKNLLGAFFR